MIDLILGKYGSNLITVEVGGVCIVTSVTPGIDLFMHSIHVFIDDPMGRLIGSCSATVGWILCQQCLEEKMQKKKEYRKSITDPTQATC